MSYQIKKKPDYFLLISALGLSAFGLVMIASASVVKSFEVTDGVTNNFFLYQQSISFVFGIVALTVCSLFPYQNFRKWAFGLLVFSIILLCLVFVPPFATPLEGSYRWISIWKIFFQPSEIVKLLFVIFLASWITSKKEHITSFFKGFLPFFLITAIFCGIILLEPDMGTATVFFIIAISMFFVAGARISHLLSLIPVGILSFWFLIKAAPYRMARVLSFFNPESDTLGISYHTRQALIAIGSGGIWGLGFGSSIQKYNYLPTPMSDSIFAVIAEELGFVRTAIVLFILGYFLFRCFKISKSAPDDFGRFLGLGITVWFCAQIVINIAAMLGVLPLTGIPLPFISYGGSSLVINLAAVGILINISKSQQA